MKHILIPTGLLCALFALALLNGAAMEQTTRRCQNDLQRSGTLALEENWNGASAALQQSYRVWMRHQAYLHIVLDHNSVDEAEAMYARCMAFAATREISEFCAETAGLITQLSLLAEMERLSIKNIL